MRCGALRIQPFCCNHEAALSISSGANCLQPTAQAPSADEFSFEAAAPAVPAATAAADFGGDFGEGAAGENGPASAAPAPGGAIPDDFLAAGGEVRASLACLMQSKSAVPGCLRFWDAVCHADVAAAHLPC